MTPSVVDVRLRTIAAIERELERRRRLRDDAPRLRRSFRDFIRASWHVVEPAYRFIPNWHVDAIADHLQAIANKQLQNLVINIPPGSAKSLIVAVEWPAWMWIRDAGMYLAPAWRALFASYSDDLSARDSMRTRSLIESTWYRDMFEPSWALVIAKEGHIENSASGFRLALSTRGKATGFRGNARVVDDPMNVTDQFSENERKRIASWWDQTMSSRLNDLAADASVVMGHRLHEEDLSGHCIAKGTYEVLSLPSEFEPERRARTFIMRDGKLEQFFEDPRKKRGELLFPGLFPPSVIAQVKTDLGSYGYAGQHQQNPAPESGGIFQRDSFKRYREAPPSFDMVIMCFDCAFKDSETSDFVAGIVCGIRRAEIVVLDLVKDRLGFDATEHAIKDLRAKWSSKDAPRAVEPWAPTYTDAVATVLIEDAANGPAIIERLKRAIPGLQAVPTAGGKYSRAWSCQGTVEAGQVYVPEGAPWAGDFITSLATFPNAKHDDDVDAFTHVVVWVRKHAHGLIQWYREESDKVNKLQTAGALIKPATNPQTESCPQCGSRSVHAVGSVWSEQKQALAESKRCGQCGHQWTP